jgi:hypothetical protein
MAFRDTIGPNPFGLKQIMNVTKKVGTESDCANRANDVEAVQKLLNLFLPTTEIFRAGFGSTNGTGRFDALTGFYIFKFQRSMLSPAGRSPSTAALPGQLPSGTVATPCSRSSA